MCRPRTAWLIASSSSAARPVMSARSGRDGRCRKVAAVIGAVVFDVGECLVDESREYGTWADWLGVPRHTFSAVFGAVIAKGLDYRETFQVFRQGFDLAKARQQRVDEGKPEWFGEDDLYPDGILRKLGLPADMIATSDDWGVSKPDPGFFRQMLEVTLGSADEILYVGDRLDKRHPARGRSWAADSADPARPVGDHPAGRPGRGPGADDAD